MRPANLLSKDRLNYYYDFVITVYLIYVAKAVWACSGTFERAFVKASYSTPYSFLLDDTKQFLRTPIQVPVTPDLPKYLAWLLKLLPHTSSGY